MEQLHQPLLEPTDLSEQLMHTIIIFVNSESGGKNGRLLTQSKIKGLRVDDNSASFIYLFQINQLDSRKKGLTFIKTLCQTINHKTNRIVTLAGGGDGTVNWLLSELVQVKVDFDKIIFGAFPLGTGNDFAKNLGWRQYKLFDNSFEDLEEFVRKIRFSRIQNFDVWEIEVEHREDGYIAQSKNGEEMRILTRPFLKQITNYFSFGMDARVGYDFDSHRSNFQFFNYALYCLIGCFNRCKSIPSVEQAVVNMEESESQTEDIEAPRMNVVFNSEDQRMRLKKYRHILALNINSYMGGVSGVWENSKQSMLKSQQETIYQPSDSSDGLLEFVAFKDQWSLGFERVFKGRARKIVQGKGPFKFQFDTNCSETYLMFDGQYYMIRQPKQIIVRRSPHFQVANLKVLRCPTIFSK